MFMRKYAENDWAHFYFIDRSWYSVTVSISRTSLPFNSFTRMYKQKTFLFYSLIDTRNTNSVCVPPPRMAIHCKEKTRQGVRRGTHKRQE